ncbi:MAG: RNA-guided pseudouridylation complex pseudouridine synthase subunit Cbf5 [Candidatus Hodarchaeales archaeon]|jgi:H/ACA ribonucleoprotein complex subunit 4
MTSPFFVKIENYQSSPEYGLSPEKRSVPELLNLGIINLDKPANPTSHEVTAWVKHILGVKKAGHGGTLDPSVTGCLPIALGRATRSLQVLLPAGKEYICIMKLHDPRSQNEVEKVLEFFRGKIYQTPPVRSNVKRQLRVRKIYELELIEHYDSQYSLLRIKCEAGTYIRKLCHDIGLILGTGAHMHELRRTHTGPFNENESKTLQELTDAWHYYNENAEEKGIREIIQPIEAICVHLPKIFIRDSAVDAICHGAQLTLPGVIKFTRNIDKNSLLAILTMKGELVAFGRSILTSKKLSELRNGLCAKPIAVFMEKETYPSSWKKI